jgi:hypothetical protein
MTDRDRCLVRFAGARFEDQAYRNPQLPRHQISRLDCLRGLELHHRSGDACKTTILTALDFALSPRTALAFDDADFFNQVVEDDIVIQVTLAEWDPAVPHVKSFFQESTFARYQCGLDENGPKPEPDTAPAFSISLRVDKSLEPKWFG